MEIDEIIKSTEDKLKRLKQSREKLLNKKPYKERYHQRIKYFLTIKSDNPRSSFKIIELHNDYISDTVSVLFPKVSHPYGWAIRPQNMIDYNVIIKQLLHVKNGIIVSYHFTD